MAETSFKLRLEQKRQKAFSTTELFHLPQIILPFPMKQDELNARRESFFNGAFDAVIGLNQIDCFFFAVHPHLKMIDDVAQDAFIAEQRKTVALASRLCVDHVELWAQQIANREIAFDERAIMLWCYSYGQTLRFLSGDAKDDVVFDGGILEDDSNCTRLIAALDSPLNFVGFRARPKKVQPPPPPKSEQQQQQQHHGLCSSMN